MPKPFLSAITSFSAGYKPNAEVTSLRDVSADEWLNYRVTKDGYLTPRGGSVRKNTVAFGAVPETLLKSYFLRQDGNADFKHLFVVADKLQYSIDDVTFSDFSPITSIASGKRKFEHQQYQGLVLLGNGRGNQYAINIGDTTPVLYNFYLETPPNPTTVEIATVTPPGVNVGVHHYVIVYVREESTVPVAFSKPSILPSEVDVSIGTQTVTVGNILDPTDTQLLGGFGQKYVYRTTAGVVNTATYYFVGKVAVGAGTTLNDSSTDAQITTNILNSTLNKGVLPGTYQPNWYFSEIADFRMHVTEDDNDRIYLSFFDGVSEVYIRNFTDYITIGNKSEPITGIKSLSENFIIIYFPSSIWLMKTDPLTENYAVQRSPITEGIGCVAPRSIVNINGLHYFFAPDKRIYRFNGINVSWMSKNVQSELNKIPALRVDQPVACYFDGYYVFAYPDSSGANNRVLLYDTNLNRWLKDTLSVNDLFLLRNTADASDDEGELYAAIAGENYIRQLYTGAQDNGQDIVCTWKSNKYIMSSFSSIQKVSVRTGGSGTLNITASVDGTDFTDTISPTSVSDFVGQRAGFNGARGSELQLQISGTPSPEVRAILINEKF